jgi:hypothetical protein
MDTLDQKLALEKIQKLQVKKAGNIVGVSVNDLQKEFPETVSNNKYNIDNHNVTEVDYVLLIPYIISCLQNISGNQNTNIDELKTNVSLLKNEIEKNRLTIEKINLTNLKNESSIKILQELYEQIKDNVKNNFDLIKQELKDNNNNSQKINSRIDEIIKSFELIVCDTEGTEGTECSECTEGTECGETEKPKAGTECKSETEIEKPKIGTECKSETETEKPNAETECKSETETKKGTEGTKQCENKTETEKSEARSKERSEEKPKADKRSKGTEKTENEKQIEAKQSDELSFISKMKNNNKNLKKLKEELTEHKEIIGGKIFKMNELYSCFTKKIELLILEFSKKIDINDILYKELLNKNRELCDDLLGMIKRTDTIQLQVSDLYKTKFSSMKQ